MTVYRLVLNTLPVAPTPGAFSFPFLAAVAARAVVLFVVAVRAEAFFVPVLPAAALLTIVVPVVASVAAESLLLASLILARVVRVEDAAVLVVPAFLPRAVLVVPVLPLLPGRSPVRVSGLMIEALRGEAMVPMGPGGGLRVFSSADFTGERGYVRELLDLGDKTVDGASWLETTRARDLAGPVPGVLEVVVAVLLRFLGKARSESMSRWTAFSLSAEISALGRFFPRVISGVEEVLKPGVLRVAEGRGRVWVEGAPFGCSEYFSTRSIMLVLRNELGIRLTRISSRDRSPWERSAYCARSFRALSVTKAYVRLRQLFQ